MLFFFSLLQMASGLLISEILSTLEDLAQLEQVVEVVPIDIHQINTSYYFPNIINSEVTVPIDSLTIRYKLLNSTHYPERYYRRIFEKDLYTGLDEFMIHLPWGNHSYFIFLAIDDEVQTSLDVPIPNEEISYYVRFDYEYRNNYLVVRIDRKTPISLYLLHSLFLNTLYKNELLSLGKMMQDHANVLNRLKEDLVPLSVISTQSFNEDVAILFYSKHKEFIQLWDNIERKLEYSQHLINTRSYFKASKTHGYFESFNALERWIQKHRIPRSVLSIHPVSLSLIVVGSIYLCLLLGLFKISIEKIAISV